MIDPCDPSLPTGSDLRPDLSSAIQADSVDCQPHVAGRIRLGCIHCDRDDYDRVDELPTDWMRVAPIQDWLESLYPVDPNDPVEQCLFAWQTHLGICPMCDTDSDQAECPEEVPSIELKASMDFQADREEAQGSPEVHPIIRQIIERDCHVGDSAQGVIRNVISKLHNGYETYRCLSMQERERFVADCVQHHAAIFRQHVEVMSGFKAITIVTRQAEVVPIPFTGSELVSLMRKHKVTIRELAQRIGTSMKRVRQMRTSGITDVLVLRDWLQAITGKDPGPIANKYRIRGRTKRTDCSFCGCPLICGDEAYEYVGDVFCSLSCCRQSKDWK